MLFFCARLMSSKTFFYFIFFPSKRKTSFWLLFTMFWIMTWISKILFNEKELRVAYFFISSHQRKCYKINNFHDLFLHLLVLVVLQKPSENYSNKNRKRQIHKHSNQHFSNAVCCRRSNEHKRRISNCDVKKAWELEREKHIRIVDSNSEVLMFRY